jgi:PAS domain-containing protein
MKQWDIRGLTQEIAPGTSRPAQSATTRVVDRDLSVAIRPTIDSLRVLVDQLPAVFWTTNESLTFTSALGASLSVLGLGPNQIVGMTVQDFFPAQHSPAGDAHRRALEGESVPYRMVWGDRVFQAHVAPLHDGEGGTIGTICVAVDAMQPDAEQWRFLSPG